MQGVLLAWRRVDVCPGVFRTIAMSRIIIAIDALRPGSPGRPAVRMRLGYVSPNSTRVERPDMAARFTPQGAAAFLREMSEEFPGLILEPVPAEAIVGS
jgi:hypothetical protein